MSKKVLYIRIRGRVLGPFDVPQLKSLRQRGQFNRFHEVSEDRQRWYSAATLDEVFATEEAGLRLEEPAPPKERMEAGAGGAGGAGPAPATEWYYADAAGKQNGPVATAGLLGLVEKGVVSADTLVWREGLTNWVPLSSPETGLTNLPPGPRRRKLTKVLIFVGLVVGFFALFLVVGFLVLKWTGWWQRNSLRPKNQDEEVVIVRLKDPAPPPEITAAYKDKVFQVKLGPPAVVKDPAGSGVLIAHNRKRGLVATNRHVLAPGKFDKPVEPDPAEILNLEVSIRNPSQLTYKLVRVAGYHRRLDVALLVTEMDGDQPSAIPVLKKKSLDQGEDAVALGFPTGLAFSTANGIIANTTGKGGLIWTTCPINSGNSGGPLFIARRGYLVGITASNAKGEPAPNLNGAVPAEDVVAPLKAEQTDNWAWSDDLKDLTLELVKTIPVEE